MEGSQRSDCRITHWGDGFLFPLGHTSFPKDSLIFFLVSQPSFPNSALPTFVLTFSKTHPVISPGAEAWTVLPRATTSLQTHILSPHPKLPAQHPKEKPSLREAG